MLEIKESDMEKQKSTNINLNISELRYIKRNNKVLGKTYIEYDSESTILVSGPVGSGKTSLLYSLSAVIPNIERFRKVHYNGELSYTEQNKSFHITLKNYRWFFQRIAVLFQYPDNNFIALRVIDEFNLLKKTAYDPRNLEYDRLLFQLKIRDLGLASLTNLSEGQKQMVALACMFLRNPGNIFLDEPLTMLDRVNRKLFIDWLVDFKKVFPTKGLAIATHKPMLFQSLTPRIFSYHNSEPTFIEVEDALTQNDISNEIINTKSIQTVPPYHRSNTCSRSVSENLTEELCFQRFIFSKN